jgi:hypothetical protein
MPSNKPPFEKLVDTEMGSTMLNDVHSLIEAHAGQLNVADSDSSGKADKESTSLPDQINALLNKREQILPAVGDDLNPGLVSPQRHINNQLCRRHYNTSIGSFTRRYLQLEIAAHGGNINPTQLATLRNAEKAALERYMNCIRAPKSKLKTGY